MLPVVSDKHQNVVLRRLPWITFALIAINVIVFLFISFSGPVEDLEQNPIWQYGHKPADPYLASYFTSMFLHVGLLHLLGNMLFLYLAGSSIEDLWGRPLYLCFYFSAGILTAIINDLGMPQSEVSFVGASGAIAGLMGAFIVRLYKTKITFVYITSKFKQGTFQLPAWVVLPLWFIQVVFLRTILENKADPAYLAHTGVFLFGALFAFILRAVHFEEKYINAFVERQVGTSSQDAVFQQAIDLSHRSEFVQATNLLKQVIAQEPDHMEAHMELRRIADLNGDRETYSLHTGAMLEALIRKRKHEAISEFYRESQTNRVVLPARTLLAMGFYQEQIPDLRSALDIYQKLVDQHKDDPLAVKAYSRMARLCLEKFGDRRRGAELLEQAYRQTKNEEWRGILKADFKRYDIAVPFDAKPAPAAPGIPAVSNSVPAPDFHEVFSEEPSEIELPNAIFEGQKRGWSPVNCRLDKMEDAGLSLKNQQEMLGILKWNHIKGLAVGRIRIMSPGSTKPEKDFLITDFITRALPGQDPVIYRLNSQQLNLKKLFPEERNSMLAFKNMIEQILDKTFADCFPGREQCTGPTFPIFASLNQYDEQLKVKISNHEI